MYLKVHFFYEKNWNQQKEFKDNVFDHAFVLESNPQGKKYLDKEQLELVNFAYQKKNS